MNDFAGMQTEIMQVALDKYLGSEDQWCAGALARDKDGGSLGSALHVDATQHCAEGAIMAATYDVLRTDRHRVNWRLPSSAFSNPVLKGVEQVLVQQHPDFVEAIKKANGAEEFTAGSTLPLFNDGAAYGVTSTVDDENDNVAIITATETFPGVGYAGIRAAFEKYLAECEEKGL